MQKTHSRKRHNRRITAMTYSSRTLITVLALGALVLGCSPATGQSASPTGAPSEAPSAAPSQPASAAPSPIASSGIVLERTGPIGCDSIGVDYHSVTINIDPASDPAVWAGTDTAQPGKIAVKWTDGFTATDEPEIVVRGPKGEEVARDGTVINVPAGANPRLAGYFVCLAPNAVYVLETDPQ
jgi:hypothetical protein